MRRIICVYKITCEINNEFYIGSSVNLYMRWYVHLSELRRNKHHSQKLQDLYNKFGEKSLKISIVKEYDNCDRKQLYEYEKEFIERLSPTINEVSVKECHVSDEWRKKISNTITELFKDKNNHPRYKSGKLYDVYNTVGDMVYHNMSIIDFANMTKGSYHTYNNMIRRYDGIGCTKDNSFAFVKSGMNYSDIIFAYKNTVFNQKCPVCDIDGNKYKRGHNFIVATIDGIKRKIEYGEIYRMIMNSNDMYVNIDGNIYTLPFLCRHIQKCISEKHLNIFGS